MIIIAALSGLGAIASLMMTLPHLCAWHYRDSGAGRELLKTGNSFITGCVTGSLCAAALCFALNGVDAKGKEETIRDLMLLTTIPAAIPAITAISDSLSIMTKAGHYPHDATDLRTMGLRNTIIAAVNAMSVAAFMTATLMTAGAQPP